MGTNYYLHSEPFEPLHIGKSSAGWAFHLHVTDTLRTFDDWRIAFSTKGVIRDEYGRNVTPEEMVKIITERKPTWAKSEIDGVHCVGHGEGTWDLIEGEFS